MTLLRCATHTVCDARDAARRFADWLDYREVESGVVAPALAAAWGAPGSAGRRYTLCGPASGAEIFLRFVEGDPVSAYAPMRSHGWAAIEICVQDVTAVAARLRGSPFEVIGPPSQIPGLATIHPMQVRGPDLETIYLTQILDTAPDSGLPFAASPIDSLFILVLACADMRASARWFRDIFGIDIDAPAAIRYRMISRAFDLPEESLHEIMTGRHGRTIFLEFDQYPPAALARPCVPGALPPGVSVCTLAHKEFDAIGKGWLQPPVVMQGALYAGRRVGVLRSPEGALVEIIDAA